MNTPKDCSQVGERLPEFLAGRLTPDEESQVRQHLEGCIECRSRANTVSLLQQTPIPAPDPDRWDHFVEGVVAAAESRRPRRGLWLAVAGVAAAAVLVLILVLDSLESRGWGEAEAQAFAREVAALPEEEARAWTIGLVADEWMVPGDVRVPELEATSAGEEGNEI